MAPLARIVVPQDGASLQAGPARLIGAGLDEVLMVGHEPDFSDAIAQLTGGRVDIKKGGLAAVHDRELRVLLRARETKTIARLKDS